MSPLTVITMLVAAFCGLTRRLVASLVGALALIVIGLAHLVARPPAPAHHVLLHGFHLFLAFNAAYAVSAFVAAMVL